MLKNTKTSLSSLVGLALFLFSCSNNSQEQAPINREKMSALLIDIHFAEAYSGILSKDSNAKPLSLTGKNIDSLAVYYQAVFSKHKIQLAQWEKALTWYTQHPQELDSVYARILPILDSLKTKSNPIADTVKSN